jgi:hypothetical protein
MALGILIKSRRVAEPPRIITGFDSLDQVEVFVSHAGLRDMVHRSGPEGRQGDIAAAEAVSLSSYLTARNKEEPGFTKGFTEAQKAHADRKAKKAEREAEYRRQRAEQRAAEQREREIAEAVRRKAAEAEREQILAWREEAEQELQAAQ